jgi:hypothetical protein
MALEKVIVIDRIEILEDGQIQVREATKILEDGKELSRSFHRHVLAPTDLIDREDAKVQAISAAVWTKEVVDAYKTELIAVKPVTKPVEP